MARQSVRKNTPKREQYAADLGFGLSFVDMDTGQVVYSCRAVSASNIEAIGKDKFPRWKDVHEKDVDGEKGRTLRPSQLQANGVDLILKIDPWVAAVVRSR